MFYVCCCRSCINLGYFEDDFLRLFVRRRTKRPPIINRGYFARVQAIRQVIDCFVESTVNTEEGTKGGQILSLGSGWDTTFFRLKASKCQPGRYIEVDHKQVKLLPPFRLLTETNKRVKLKILVVVFLFRCLKTHTHSQVTTSKCRSVQKNQSLIDLIAGGGGTLADDVEIDAEGGRIFSEQYALVPCDLRDIEGLKTSLEVASVNYQAPTLGLLECVLAYLDEDSTRNLLKLISDSFESCCILIYDMIGPDDPFGQQLIFNVESRGCPLPGIRSFPTKDAHAKLLQQCGFSTATGVHNMLEIYQKYLDGAERKRTERIEFLDELEEWNLIMSHYCLSYGAKGSSPMFSSEKMPLKL